jgi:hypothetical protein
MHTKFLLAAAAALAFAAPAEAVVPGQDPGALAGMLVNLVTTIGIPIGGAILFLSVALMAIKLLFAGLSGNPHKHAEAMGGLLWIGIGGVILGGALFIAGVFLELGKRLS